jgi:hypothetical protein
MTDAGFKYSLTRRHGIGQYNGCGWHRARGGPHGCAGPPGGWSLQVEVPADGSAGSPPKALASPSKSATVTVSAE